MSAENKARIISIPEFKPIELKTLELLRRDDYVLLDLRGENLDKLGNAGLNFDVEFEPLSYYFKQERAINGQIAINPNDLWIPETEHRSLVQQEAKAAELNSRLSRVYPGVKVEMGRVTDWLSAAYHYQLINEDKPLFREVGRWLRTQSATDLGKTANIGIKQNPLNPHEWRISVTQSPYFMPNPSLHAAYFLRAA